MTQKEFNTTIAKLINETKPITNWKESNDKIMAKWLDAKKEYAIFIFENKDAINEALNKIRAHHSEKKKSEGGIEKSITLCKQDLQKLKSNDFDKAFGKNFLTSSVDSGITHVTYWINNDKTVTPLCDKKDELIVQLANDKILNEVLWPEFLKQKENVLAKMNSSCPFEIDSSFTFWPWKQMSNFSNYFQDCMSSWFLEHFLDNNSNIKFKAIENKSESGETVSYEITEFTDIFTQMSKDEFIMKFQANLSFLRGRYSNSINYQPLPYTDNNSDDYAFIKLDLKNLVQEGECPIWDLALKERFDTEEEAEVFKAAIWQVYNPKNRSRQLIYLYDPHGRSGKSAMLRAAFSPIKEAQFAVQKNSLNNNFGFAKVWNKQLVTIGDNKNRMLLKSQIIHTMTGGDEADVEYKGKNSFMAAFKGHVWANGNVMLDIDTDAEHEVSRLVLFKINKPESAKSILYQTDENGEIIRTIEGSPLLGEGDPSWEDKLVAELPYFLFKCKISYAKYCPHDSDLILPMSMQNRIQQECVELNKQIFDAFFDESVEFDKTYSVSDSDLRSVWTTWKELNLNKFEVQRNELTFANLAEHLSKLNYKCTMMRKDKRRLRVWSGIKIIDEGFTNVNIKTIFEEPKKVKEEIDWGF